MWPVRFLTRRERKFASRSLRRWIAPTRHVFHREKAQYRRRGQFFPTVQSAACSELLAPPVREKPEKIASCRDRDKRPVERQGNRRSGDKGLTFVPPLRDYGAASRRQRSASGLSELSPYEQKPERPTLRPVSS